MTFITTGRIEYTGNDEAEDFYIHPFYDELRILGEKSDFLMVTTKDGKEHLTAAINYSGGRCDCCSEFHTYDIKKAEGFKRG